VSAKLDSGLPKAQTLSAELQNQRTLAANSPIYETLSRKLQMPDFQLSWSHYQSLMRIEDKDERPFMK